MGKIVKETLMSFLSSLDLECPIHGASAAEFIAVGPDEENTVDPAKILVAVKYECGQNVVYAHGEKPIMEKTTCRHIAEVLAEFRKSKAEGGSHGD